MSGQSGGHRLRLSKLNEQLTCTLCTGYLIDATTIIECLHSFCRSCIVKYLEVNKYCPICEVLVHKSKPLLNIRPDNTLQDIVYKLVPACYQNEMRCRRDFYAKHPEGKNSTMLPESRGEPIESHIYSPDESLSLSLEYFNPETSAVCEDDSKEIVTKPLPRRYLRCPAAVTIFHLQKLIRAKYGLSEAHRVDVMYKEEPLCGSYTLMDVMYIYHWRRKVPLHLSYRIFESSSKRIKLSEDNNEFKQTLSNSGISPVESKEEQSTKRGWKEVQLKISETGVMSVTDITSPDSKKSTKVKEIDGQSSSDLLQNIETLDKSVNTPKIVLEDEPRSAKSSKHSASKLKNLTEPEDKRIAQESKRSLADKKDEVKEFRETKDSKEGKEGKDAKVKESKVNEAKETKDAEKEKEIKENKKERTELAKKEKRENREELEITSRVPDEKPSIKKNENQRKEKEKNLTSAGSKIDALSAKLQFQPKVGQVNNTYSKKTPKESKKMKAEPRKDLKKDSNKTSESESSKIPEVSKSSDLPQISEVSKSLPISNSTYVTAPSISSDKNQMNLQQALTSLGRQIRPEDSCKSLLPSQLNQKSNFRNNLSPSSESLASIGLNVSTTITGQGSNFGFMMPDLGMLSPDSKIQNPPLSQAPLSKTLSSSQTITVQSSPVQSSSQTQSSSQIQSPSQIHSSSQVQTSSQSKAIPPFNIQPSMSIYSISGKNNLYNQSSSKSSKSDFEITSVYPVPPCPDTIPISLMKPSIRKHEVIAKGTNLNEICAKIGTSGSKINDICAKIGENSKEKNKTESRRPDLPDLLKITKAPSSEFLKHIPNIPNVPIYTPSNSSVKDLDRKNSAPSLSQKITPKKTPHVGYKTLKDPPKPWNPTLSKNNYVAVKNHSQIADGGSSKPILSKPARIFKMRNVPRYLGNPASGVKPMYGGANEKEKEQASKNNSMNVSSMIPSTMSMMKIDPKTLSPIVSTVNSPIVSPPPYSPNARSYQNSPFSREMCRNTGSPISPRNSPVNMLSTNPFIPSPTPNTNPRLIYSHFPPPFPDASRFPNPLIRTPVGIPPPSAFHSSLPPSINKLYQRSSYIPQTSGYNPGTQPPTVQRIPPSTHSSAKTSPTSSVSFNLKTETVVSSSENNLKEKVFNLSKSDVSDLSEKSKRVEEKEKEKEKERERESFKSVKEDKIDLESKVNGDIIDLEEEERQKSSGKEPSKEVNPSKDLNQSLKESNIGKDLNPPSKESTQSLMEVSKKVSNDLKESTKQSLKENTKKSLNDSSKENSKDPIKEIANESLKESSKESSKESLKESKDSKEGGTTNPKEDFLVEKNKDLPQEKIAEMEKEIQGKKTESQRNKAES